MKYYFHVVNLPISKLIWYQYRLHTYVDKARKLIPEFTCCLSHTEHSDPTEEGILLL